MTRLAFALALVLVPSAAVAQTAEPHVRAELLAGWIVVGFTVILLAFERARRRR